MQTSEPKLCGAPHPTRRYISCRRPQKHTGWHYYPAYGTMPEYCWAVATPTDRSESDGE